MSGPVFSAAPLLLALHSSSETLAVGVCPLAAAGQPLDDGELEARCAQFPLGRGLSNALFSCVEEVLPADQWPRLGRLVVATGPGGFTGTRLTVVLARTLAQQLGIPVHGFGSFFLMARRWCEPGAPMAAAQRFWLQQQLPRRGSVAGCYGPDPGAFGGVSELEPPRLWRLDEALPWQGDAAEPMLPAVVDPLADVRQLAHAEARPGPWPPVLPLYPTSPVEGV
jgi:tRNA threonylcarbamoyladenosine biosynthesis protein TsaB